MKGDEERCIAAGMDGFMSKPIDRLKLEACLTRIFSLTQVKPEPDAALGAAVTGYTG
jgi:CheY-like chemotaxis protein